MVRALSSFKTRKRFSVEAARPAGSRGLAGEKDGGPAPRENAGTSAVHPHAVRPCAVHPCAVHHCDMYAPLLRLIFLATNAHALAVNSRAVHAAHRAGLRCTSPRCNYQVRIPKPLGIAFEEVTPGGADGVVVAELIENGNADTDGRILVGDKLLRCSAVSFTGQSALVTLGAGTQFTSFKRDLIPCTQLDFETIMAAIGSNEGRYGYNDVVLELRHTDDSVPRSTGASGAVRPSSSTSAVEWDAAKGTTNGGKSVPLKPPPDAF